MSCILYNLLPNSLLRRGLLRLSVKTTSMGLLVLRFTIQIELSLILKRVLVKSAWAIYARLALHTSCRVHKGTFIVSDGLILFREPFRAPFPKLYSLVTAHKSY